ncbi:MAG TPA: NADH-quinone oxidoreductase subunit J [Verrucomicrobiae bacterium]|nr:NADH-quinone oxidoreductase subunit J [Verrucomicrobiae bacterium]
MNVHDMLFYSFSVAMLVCGFLVIFSRNPVASALFLVMLFAFLAGLFVLLEAFFIAAIQVLVYAGAVMVLFLFVIMLLDIKASERRKFRTLGVVGGIAVAAAFVWELETILARPLKPLSTGNQELHGGLEQIVRPFFANYLLPFEITALLLLVAMIGVVLLSRKELK